MDNVGEVRPTVMSAVPRIFEKVYAKVVGNVAATPGVKGKLFRWPSAASTQWAAGMEPGGEYGRAAARRSAREARLLQAATHAQGALRRPHAPLRLRRRAAVGKEVAYFFDVRGLQDLRGLRPHGDRAATCVNLPDKIRIGTVGPALPGTELKIADDGEILVRGRGVMKGYYKKPEATAEALDADGWFHTGDIGEVDADGYLRITDRKKDIIVTAGGKNVAPQNLENALKTDPLISQVVVIGDKRKFLTALMTVNAENAVKWAADHGSPARTRCRIPELRAKIQARWTRSTPGGPSYATIKKFVPPAEDFRRRGAS